MERVALLIEETGERLSCLLNPENLLVQRQAGLRPRRSSSGPLSGAALTDEPLLYTGGGFTELRLDLLFDVSISGSSIQSRDVRDLTGPIWALAENRSSSASSSSLPSLGGDTLPFAGAGATPVTSPFSTPGYATVPHVRFIWGKVWNIRAVVLAVAERLEQFAASGEPGRSWMRLRLRRVADDVHASAPRAQPLLDGFELPTGDEEIPDEEILMHPLVISPGEGTTAATAESTGEVPPPEASERLEQLAERYFGDSALWRLIAAFNKIIDPLKPIVGDFLRIPPPSIIREREE